MEPYELFLGVVFKSHLIYGKRYVVQLVSMVIYWCSTWNAHTHCTYLCFLTHQKNTDCKSAILKRVEKCEFLYQETEENSAKQILQHINGRLEYCDAAEQAEPIHLLIPPPTFEGSGSPFSFYSFLHFSNIRKTRHVIKVFSSFKEKIIIEAIILSNGSHCYW